MPLALRSSSLDILSVDLTIITNHRLRERGIGSVVVLLIRQFPLKPWEKMERLNNGKKAI